jgi:3-phosphoshikimate 1-carboxyvinyltransferase
MPRPVLPAAGPLRGTACVPGDKSLSHRAALFAPLGDGPARVRGFLRAQDTLRSLAAVRDLGADVRDDGSTLTIGPGDFPATGRAAAGAPQLEIDCGNSGTTARLLLGLLAGRRVRALLDGDASLRSRPMGRVVAPLRALGADVAYRGAEGRLPLLVTGAALRGGEHAMASPSAQVASALLLAALSSPAPVTVRGCRGARDHTPRLLAAMGADLGADLGGWAPGDDAVTLRRGPPLRAIDHDIPADPSSAAFLLGAAALVPGSRVTVPGVLLNPTRGGFLAVLREMGADLAVAPDAAAADGAEPTAAVTVGAGALRAVRIEGAGRVATLVDELPLLAVLAARARGTTELRDAAELRVKESDRLAAVAAGLRGLGVAVTEYPDGLDIAGEPEGFPARDSVPIATHGDHRIAMAFAVAGLASRAGVVLDDEACVAVSFPDFFAACAALQGAGSSG